MRKISPTHPVWSYNCNRHIISDVFQQYFNSAKAQLQPNLLKFKHPEYQRAFIPVNTNASMVWYIKSQAYDPEQDKQIKGECEFWIKTLYPRPQKWRFELSIEGLIVYMDGVSASAFDKILGEEPNGDIQRKWAEELSIEVLCLCLFMDVADIFEEIVKPKQKIHLHNCRYQNKGKQDLIFLNANYIKTSIRDAGFPVRGHFRWQRHGKGLSSVKLIFVDSYEKKGYKIEAKRDS